MNIDVGDGLSIWDTAHRYGYLPYRYGHPGYRYGIWAYDMGDDSIDMVISHIDMGYLVTLNASCSPHQGLERRHHAAVRRSPRQSRASGHASHRRGGGRQQGRARVTRYDPISIWEIDMGDRTSMGFRYGIQDIDLGYGMSICLSTISIWSSWISIWDMV